MKWLSGERPGEDFEIDAAEVIFRIKKRWRGFGFVAIALGLGWCALASILREPIEGWIIGIGFVLFPTMAIWGASLQTEHIRVGSDGLRKRVFRWERVIHWDEVQAIHFMTQSGSFKVKGPGKPIMFDQRYVKHAKLAEMILERTHLTVTNDDSFSIV